MKVVINTAPWGSFNLSLQALVAINQRKGFDPVFYDIDNTIVTVDQALLIGKENLNCIINDFFERNDPDLVAVVEELGELAEDHNTKLKVVEIPDNIEYFIENRFDESEYIAEAHRVWS